MARKLFDPKSTEPFRISRSKLQLFLDCPKCFYLDVKLGIGRPAGYPFTLNSAVDYLLKKEFDIHRAKGQAHPLMIKYGVKAVPLAHEKINQWRDSLGGGIGALHKKTNFWIFGGIDDVWQNEQGQLIIVDYKATSKNGKIDMDSGQGHHKAYRNEVEVYQWLFKNNGFKVADITYFVYCNAHKDRTAFDGKLEFDIELIPHQGKTDWIEPALIEARKCLVNNKIPATPDNCDYCQYVNIIEKSEYKTPLNKLSLF